MRDSTTLISIFVAVVYVAGLVVALVRTFRRSKYRHSEIVCTFDFNWES